MILSNTNFGKGSTLPSQEVLKVLSTSSSGEFNYDGLVNRMKPAVSAGYFKDSRGEFDEIVRMRLRVGDDAKGYMGQLYGVASFDSYDRLGSVDVPTLVVTSEEDVVVPPPNAEELHRCIPTSKLVIFRGAGHLLCVERSRDFNHEVLSFIDEIESGRFSRIEPPVYV